jgi:ABC-2 type transport system permease protein
VKPTFFRRLLQIGTFLRKESIDVLHQPRLLLTLVIGPFAIMAIFGIGYRDTPKPMRTLFVGPVGSPLLAHVQNYTKQLSFYVDFAGTTNDAAAAQRRLLAGDIDLIVSFPDDPLKTVAQNKQATITVTHTRLDPIEQTAITFASQLAVDRINSQVLATTVKAGKAYADPAVQVLAQADDALASLDKAINTRDAAAVRKSLQDVQATVAELNVSGRINSALTQEVGPAQSQDASVASAQKSIADVQAAVQNLDATSTAADVSKVRNSIAQIRDNYGQLSTVDPAILVQPFGREVQLAVPNTGNVTDWYAPAAIVLMLQQFGVAFGALSFVRERQLGIVEVLRVAPVNATETVIGKYLSYLLIGGAIAATLTTLVVNVLGVPIQTTVGTVAIAMGLSLFASIGLGFVISLISATDAQAVQYTMIMLLASLFFSGFFLSIGQMEGVAHWASYLLPVSYGMRVLRDVMLRGASLDGTVTLQLLAYGVVMFALALWGTRRRLAVAR